MTGLCVRGNRNKGNMGKLQCWKRGDLKGGGGGGTLRKKKEK